MSHYRIVQFVDTDGSRHVARVGDDGASLEVVAQWATLYDLAFAAIESGLSLTDQISAAGFEGSVDYEDIASNGRLLSPIDHADPAHLSVTGTGLTHLGSANARDRMHAAVLNESEGSLTDSMRMFRLGLERGKPTDGTPGVQPEWFYKGDGTTVVAPGQPLVMPSFALDGGEEPEIAGVYLIGPDGSPWRLGHVIGNEFADHTLERENYLYLAHSKLRQCSIGPELRVGALPEDVVGRVAVHRDGEILWESEWRSGEENMSHYLAGLEHHHFKYDQFRRPGDVHIHLFGTAVLSFTAGVTTRPGDEFEISAEGFGRPLRNRLAQAPDTRSKPVKVL